MKWFFVAYLTLIILYSAKCHLFTQEEIIQSREEVREMFYHTYDNYMKHAFPADELKPISCAPRDRLLENRGHLDDSLGNFSLTLVDSLDTLAVLGDWSGFENGMHLLIERLSFNQDYSVSVFETNIRVLGGLLAIHLVATEHKNKLTRPYNGEILNLAEDLADRLMPAFMTPTGIPYSRVNLKYGVPLGETVETCTAGAGTLFLEFGTLSRLTGKPKYEEAARKALVQLYQYRSHLDLVGNIINTMTGKWSHVQSGLGAGADSFYEYLLKAYILFGEEEFFTMFDKLNTAAKKHIKRDGWYLQVNMRNGQLIRDWVDSLQAFWPGLLVLAGDLPEAKDMHAKLHAIWKQVGFLPEGYSIRTNRALPGVGGYPLRPEFAESTYMLYQATKDHYYLQVGREIISSLQTLTRVPCGFASIADPDTRRLEDRLDSYFLSETLKYLYLLFDEENIYNKGNYIFTTEGHMLPLSLQSHVHSTPVTSQSEQASEKASTNHRDAPFCQAENPEDDILRSEEDIVVEDIGNCRQPKFNTIKLEIGDKAVIPYVTVKVNSPSLIAGSFFGTPAAFGPNFNTTGVTGLVVQALPAHSCTPLANGDKVKGNIVLAMRGNCVFADKVLNAQESGAIAVIVVDDRLGKLFTMSGDKTKPSPRIPSVFVTQKDGELLREHMGASPLSVDVFATEPYQVDPQTYKVSLDGETAPPQHSSVIFQINNPEAFMGMSETEIANIAIAEIAKYGITAEQIFSVQTDFINPIDLQQMQSATPKNGN